MVLSRKIAIKAHISYYCFKTASYEVVFFYSQHHFIAKTATCLGICPSWRRAQDWHRPWRLGVVGEKPFDIYRRSKLDFCPAIFEKRCKHRRVPCEWTFQIDFLSLNFCKKFARLLLWSFTITQILNDFATISQSSFII